MRICQHGHVRQACAHCIDRRNHGADTNRSTKWYTPAWQKKVAWWKYKAARGRYETEASYKEWLEKDRSLDDSRRGMTR